MQTISNKDLSLGTAFAGGTTFGIYTDPDKEWLFAAHPTLNTIMHQITVRKAQQIAKGSASNWLDTLATKAYELYLAFNQRI